MCSWCESSSIADLLTVGFSRATPGRRAFGASAHSAGHPKIGDTRPTKASAAPDVIFRNGTIRTMATGRRLAEALAIAGTKIVAVGSTAEVSSLAGSATQIIDLEGRTLLPGLIDPHHHFTLSALVGRLLLDIGHSRFRSREAALAELKSVAGTTPPGEWIAAGFFDNILQSGNLSMNELDAVSTEHPIFVLYVNGHVGAANGLAFTRAGIGPGVDAIAGGGHFGHGPDGNFNGLIYEQPALMRFAAVALPQTTPELIATALTSYTKQVVAAGNTTLHEPGTVKPEWVEDLAQLSNSLDVRLSASFSTDAIGTSAAFAALGPAAKARMIPSSRFSLYRMKLWADGSNQAEMAAQTQPYLNSAEKGKANYPVPEMARLCRAAKDAGWPVLIHCQGDAAVDDALDAIAQAYGANPDTGINRIEHATMARRDQIDRMKELGVEPSFIPDFLHLYGAAYRDQIFGSPRAEFMIPFGAAAKRGLPFSLHSDAPATGLPVNPLRHIQTAVTRRCSTDNSVIGPDLAVTLDAAFRAITIAAARQIGLADTIGTLEPGKEADLTILEHDPYQSDPEQIMKIPVSET